DLGANPPDQLEARKREDVGRVDHVLRLELADDPLLEQAGVFGVADRILDERPGDLEVASGLDRPAARIEGGAVAVDQIAEGIEGLTKANVDLEIEGERVAEKVEPSLPPREFVVDDDVAR